ncbi:uncharacterized protein F4822DRAFT_429685 [Hypoxylon trugodes]|uniref:uncharacterized protein n=1 Tax=Hypoxylon trugodes TaxID=326681 RepID=UPI002194250A|nr:uncharacterized protein F4822DRAFT_429685 [Hypoxylon trugodes]KAI1389073.1 hypothetical protein F4822DRAFT_429685 [Hypoxylon trugodes]
MSSSIPTTEHRYFKPSEQLLGQRARGSNQTEGNYRGDMSLPSNTGADVKEEDNTNLWITGLPGSITYHELLGAITKTGRIRSSVINQPNEGTATAAASISFFKRQEAEVLYHAIDEGKLMIGGQFPRVRWNRNRVAEPKTTEYVSRVLLVVGDLQVVNREYLERFWAGKFVYDIDEVINHGTTTAEDSGPLGRLEYRFGSWRAQAAMAAKSLNEELAGFLKTEFGKDPCDV